MSVIAAILIVLAQSAADPINAYRGQPVLAVDFAGAEPEELAELRNLVEIEPGYLLAAVDVQDAVKRIYALGRYSDVRVYATRAQGVISLTFVVTPIKRLRNIDVHGTSGVSADGVRDATHMRRGDEVDGRATARMAERALAYLHDEGYPEATVDAAVTSDPAAIAVDVRLDVHEGKPLTAVGVAFEGEPRVSYAALHELVTTRDGKVVRTAALRQDQATLLKAYRERGFLRAVVGEPFLRARPDGVVVVFPVRAGERIAIDFSGNTVFTDTQLRGLLPTGDEPMRERDVRDLVDRVIDAYRRLGRYNTKAELRGFLDHDKNLVRYVVVITEGPPLHVVSIAFPGATAFEQDILAEQVRSLLERDAATDGILEPLSRDQKCLVDTNDEASRKDARTCPGSETPPRERWIPELYQQALDEIASVYQNLGFLSVQVGPAEPTFEGDTIKVAVPVREGIQTFIRTMAFDGNLAVESDELLRIADETTQDRPLQAPIRPGAPLSTTGVEDGRIAAVKTYRDRGYVYARVFTDVALSDDHRWADVTYRFEEGPQVHVGRVLIRGNRYTREAVIRSRITLKPGDIYKLDQAVADQRQIGALGVFSSVRVRLIDEEKPSETKDLICEVIERDRQPFEVSPGLSTADGPRLLLAYSHINVAGTASVATLSAKVNRQIFFGLYGQYADTMTQRYAHFTTLQQVERELRAGIHSPRIMPWPLTPSFRLDLVQERTNVISYSLDSTALIFGADTYPSPRWKVSLEPQISYTDLQCPSSSDCVGDVQSLRPDQLRLDNGTRRTFKIGPIITYDRRDNAFNPTRGLYFNVRAFYAIGDLRTQGVTQSVRFVTTQGNVTGYIPVWKFVLALSARGGIIGNIGQAIPIDERFFLGGRDTLRGYVERTLMPQDVCVVIEGTQPTQKHCRGTVTRTPGLPPISPGGETFILFKAELRVPLSQRFSVGVFLDAGNLWLKTPAWYNLVLRLGTGAGIRYTTPVGALALDVGVNPNPRPQNAEAQAQLHFSVGTF